MGRMSRRSMLQVPAVALGLLLVTSVAGAHEGHGRNGVRGTCVQGVNQAKAACIAGCVDTAKSEFVACFGHGSACAQTCLNARLTCEAGPLQKIHACVGDTKNPQSCRSVFKAAVLACKTDPNPSACNDAAELNALKCRQACVDAQAPNIDTCRDAFRMCIQQCPASPSGAFLDPSESF